MTIVVVGLNYRTAPLEIREKLALTGDALYTALNALRAYTLPCSPDGALPSTGIDEAVILSTCNRLELYLSTADPHRGIPALQQFLATLQNIPVHALRGHLYHLSGTEAIHHLMRVACGLDSMILGESQILGQVTRAFEAAHAARLTGAVLSHLFTQAVHAGKRAQTETAIGRQTTSVSHAGAILLMEKLNQRRAAKILLIGAGEMATLAAQALQRFDAPELVFVNRTMSHAEALVRDFGGQALTWDKLGDALTWADAVICATSAPHWVLSRAAVETAIRQRDSRPLHILDIAVPRDVEDSVRELEGVHYYDIDDLNSVVDGNVEQRKAAVPHVERIIEQETARFGEWYHSREVTPVIKTLREWAQNIADDELGHALNRLNDADERTRQIVSLMAHRLVNRLLHEPTARLRMQASEGNAHGYAYAVRELFALDDLEAVECGCGGEPAEEHQPCTLRCILPETAQTGGGL